MLLGEQPRLPHVSCRFMPTTPDNTPFDCFAARELERIQAETALEQIEFRREVSSTNDLALELAAQQGLLFPLLVLAETQTSGRGRRTNRWWSADGALTFSLVLEAAAAELPPDRWPQASLTSGLAVGEALEELLPGAETRLKWPNDVFVNRKKIAGILVESTRLQQGKLIIGIGLNVNNSLASAPPEIAALATSMCDAGEQQFPLVDVLICVLKRLVERLGWIGSQDQQLRERWQARCLLTGRQVEVVTPTDKLTGLCQGINEEGALVVQTDAGLERCFAGTINLLEG